MNKLQILSSFRRRREGDQGGEDSSGSEEGVGDWFLFLEGVGAVDDLFVVGDFYVWVFFFEGLD